MARNDYYLSPTGDNYNVNATLFGYMTDFCEGSFTLACMGPYMGSRYNQSKSTNGQVMDILYHEDRSLTYSNIRDFFFSPLGLFNFGTATLPQESFASLGNQGTPDVATIAPFWAVNQTNPGQHPSRFTAQPGHERLPKDWNNRPSPLSFLEIFLETSSLYAEAGFPAFGGNTGTPNSFVGLDFPAGGIEGGVLKNTTAAGIACLLYQVITVPTPSSLSGLLQIPLASKLFAVSKLGAIMGTLGCPVL